MSQEYGKFAKCQRKTEIVRITPHTTEYLLPGYADLEGEENQMLG